MIDKVKINVDATREVVQVLINSASITQTQADARYEPTKGADENYVTDAEKVVIGNTSNTNTGDNSANSTYSNVDNTSDANKPVSTATQTALDAEENARIAGDKITVSAKSTDFTIADSDNNSVQEVTTTGTVNVSLDDSVAVGTKLDVRLFGSGKILFTATGTATITGDLVLYGSGNTATIYKASATRWESVSEPAGIDSNTLTYAQLAGLTNDYRLESVDNLVRHVSGESDDNGWHDVVWTDQSANHISNLRGLWPLNRKQAPSGDFFSLKTGHQLTIISAPAQGLTGMTFDGVDDALNAGSNVDFDVTTAATVGGVIQCASGSSAGVQTIIAKWSPSNSIRSYHLYLNNSGLLNIAISDFTTSTRKIYQDGGATDLRDDTRHSVFFTFGPDDLKLYIDGVEVALTKSVDATCNSLQATTYDLSIGAQSAGTATFFEGLIDAPLVLAETLSATDMANLHTQII